MLAYSMQVTVCTARSLHETACAISLAHDVVPSGALAHSARGIMHISGVPFEADGTSYLSDVSLATLHSWQFRNVGRRLECDWTRILGKGGYASVYPGLVRHPQRYMRWCRYAGYVGRQGSYVTEKRVQIVSRQPPGIEFASHMAGLWRVVRPWVARAVSLLSMTPLHALAVVSHAYGSLMLQVVLKAAQVLGVVQFSAVKVLHNVPLSRGAYGCRSIEHEVKLHACN
jgi:hypothetical protein